MKLYHGTNADFGAIDLTKSKPNKDFGPGFYLTADRSQAYAMAETKVMQSGGVPFLHEYWFDEGAMALDDMRVLRFDGYTQQWADFIIKNRDRHFKTKQHDYDIVYGPIADDKVGLQVQLFMQDLIDITTLLERIKYYKITYQYYFGTEKALTYLTKTH